MHNPDRQPLSTAELVVIAAVGTSSAGVVRFLGGGTNLALTALVVGLLLAIAGATLCRAASQWTLPW
jgi:uncharacterized membrane protein YjjP (DUF1212 family)